GTGRPGACGGSRCSPACPTHGYASWRRWPGRCRCARARCCSSAAPRAMPCTSSATGGWGGWWTAGGAGRGGAGGAPPLRGCAPRSAPVRARRDAELYAVRRADLDVLLADPGSARALVRHLAARIPGSAAPAPVRADAVLALVPLDGTPPALV